MLCGLVLGGSATVLAEAEAALALFTPDAIAVTNDTIPIWPGRADYFCTLHPEQMGKWLAARHANKYSLGGEVWANRSFGQHNNYFKGVDKVITDWSGSSGLFAVKTLIEEGFDKIIVAGVPLTIEGRHVKRGKPWSGAHVFRNGWKKRLKELQPRVKSMSGWTQTLLGAPTPIWLAE